MSDVKVIRSLLDHYGIDPQLRQLQEECAELIVAVNHYFRGRYDCRSRFIEELVDVQIMLDQMREFVGPEEMDALKRHKLESLRDHLKTKQPRGNVNANEESESTEPATE